MITTMIDRIKPPPFRTIDKIEIPRAEHRKLDNGMDLFMISAGSQEITRIEFIFRAGMYHQPNTLIASCTNGLLESGTRSFTANQLSDGIDFFGSYLELQVEQDYALVTLYSLNRYLDESLKFVEELIKYPVYPEEEFRIHISNKRQKHAINIQKVNVLARRRFVELLYGSAHPYGRDVDDRDFERVNTSEIRDFFARRYHCGNCTIIAAGNLPADLSDSLGRYFGNDHWGTGSESGEGSTVPADPFRNKVDVIYREDSIQSAIRMGRLLFNKTHPDYFRFQVLNTVLGGYFGSRLMSNIREDKGYTYGIGSGVNSLVHGGYFYISTEVGCEVARATVDEVHKELKRLREEPVGENELETVRNYMLGNFLRTVDGPFALAEKFRAIWEFGLDYSYFEDYFRAVKTVTPQELRDLANKYFQPDDMMLCVAGKYDSK
jgi:zinc protease